MRTFRDRDGVEWTVWKTVPGAGVFIERRVAERRAPGTQAAPAPEERRETPDRRRGDVRKGWLSFRSASSRRRLVPVPEDWETVPEERLDLLCRLASPVRSRKARPGPVLPRPDAPQS